MELRQVRYFVMVAQRLSFTAAAEELNLAQPALSQQIRGLEQELGVTLLDRTSRRVRLTAAGEVFLRRAQQLMADADRARLEMQEFAGLARGKAVVGVIPNLGTVWLSQLLAAFHTRYPGIEMVLCEDTTMNLLNALSNGQLDVALLHETTEAWPAGITAQPLFSENLALAVSPSHALALRSQVRLTDLRDESWIMVKPGSVIRQIVHAAMTAAGFSPRVVCETGSSATACALVSAGLGVALLPVSIIQTSNLALSTLELTEPSLTRTVAMGWRANAYYAAAAKTFMSFTRESTQAFELEK